MRVFTITICLMWTCALFGGQDPVILWNNEALEAIRQNKTEGPVAARNLAVLHAAIFDAVNAIEGTYTPYRASLDKTYDADINVAVTAAAHRVLSKLYPEQSHGFDSLLLKEYKAVPESRRKKEGIRIGREVADGLLRWRQGDRADEKGHYYFSRRAGDWLPTSQFKEQPLLPLWGNVNPFCVKPLSKFALEKPPKLSSEQYADELELVYQLGGEDSSRRTPEQTKIAYFWADGPGTATPAGHWNEIAQGMSAKRRLSVSQNARLFALLNLAMADAGITCWRCKYEYRRWRPLSAIHYAGADGNPRTRKDEEWESLLRTPMHPEYVSAHSSFSGAAEAVLTAAFGANTPLKVPSEAHDMEERSYDNVRTAAEEAGFSRIYGGIHFPSGNQNGLKLGRQVGAFVLETELLPRGREGRASARGF